MQALILHLLLDQHLAFIAVRGFAQRARYRAGFFVLEFNDELPFGVDGIDDHAYILYETVLDDTRYCVSIFDERQISHLTGAPQVAVDEAVITI